MAKERSQHATPILVRRDFGVIGPLVQTSEDGPKAFDEKKVQDLVYRQPSVIPIDEIELAFQPLIPVCREMHTPAGFVDVVMTTPQGDIVLIECKLWRNPDARRAAVVQVLDYAQAISDWDYQDLSVAARKASISAIKPGESLWSLVNDRTEIGEAVYCDAVTRNLRRGRVLLILLGDGIRENAENLTEFVQVHAGAHFTLALVELSVWHLPQSDDLLIVPRVPARTKNVERGIVVLHEGTKIEPSPRTPEGRSQRARTLSEEEFWDQIEISSDEKRRLQDLLDKAEAEDVAPEFGRTLILRLDPPYGTPANLGAINLEGRYETALVHREKFGEPFSKASKAYLDELASALGAEVQLLDKQFRVRDQTGQPPAIKHLLSQEEQWLAAVRNFRRVLGQISDAPSTEVPEA